MKRSALLSLAPALALAACGGDERTPPPPTGGSIADPITYFGVTACRCYEYVPEDAGNLLRLGVAVESVSDVFTPGTEQHIVRYRVNGQVKRVDFYQPTDPTLLLTWVNTGDGDNDDYYEIEGGLPFVTGPVESQQTVTGDATVRHKLFGQDQGELAVSMRADYAAQPVTASIDDGATEQEFAATRLLYQGLPWSEQVRWFVPDVGFVKLELELDDQSGRVTWILNNVRQLEGGCPWRPGDTPQDTCGI